MNRLICLFFLLFLTVCGASNEPKNDEIVATATVPIFINDWDVGAFEVIYKTTSNGRIDSEITVPSGVKVEKYRHNPHYMQVDDGSYQSVEIYKYRLTKIDTGEVKGVNVYALRYHDYYLVTEPEVINGFSENVDLGVAKSWDFMPTWSLEKNDNGNALRPYSLWVLYNEEERETINLQLFNTEDVKKLALELKEIPLALRSVSLEDLKQEQAKTKERYDFYEFVVTNARNNMEIYQNVVNGIIKSKGGTLNERIDLASRISKGVISRLNQSDIHFVDFTNRVNVLVSEVIAMDPELSEYNTAEYFNDIESSVNYESIKDEDQDVYFKKLNVSDFDLNDNADNEAYEVYQESVRQRSLEVNEGFRAQELDFAIGTIDIRQKYKEKLSPEDLNGLIGIAKSIIQNDKTSLDKWFNVKIFTNSNFWRGFIYSYMNTVGRIGDLVFPTSLTSAINKQFRKYFGDVYFEAGTDMGRALSITVGLSLIAKGVADMFVLFNSVAVRKVLIGIGIVADAVYQIYHRISPLADLFNKYSNDIKNFFKVAPSLNTHSEMAKTVDVFETILDGRPSNELESILKGYKLERYDSQNKGLLHGMYSNGINAMSLAETFDQGVYWKIEDGSSMQINLNEDYKLDIYHFDVASEFASGFNLVNPDDGDVFMGRMPNGDIQIIVHAKANSDINIINNRWKVNTIYGNN